MIPEISEVVTIERRVTPVERCIRCARGGRTHSIKIVYNTFLMLKTEINMF